MSPANNPQESHIKRVLLIEDDLFIGEMYMRSLRRAGYDVELIANGEEGLRAALDKQYDLILLDIILPDKRGTDILHELRGTERGDLVPNSRILVLTNYEQDDESKLAMQHKADGYLIKADITPRRLLEIIKTL